MAKVTITFDNGPEPAITHHVLDVLARHGVKSSFFVIGRKMESAEGRAAVARAKDEGHWIGNHSYTHSISLGDSDDPALYDAEVTRSQEIIGALAHPDRLFRPFCNAGVMDSRVFKRGHIARLAEDGYTCVMFNAVTRDWEDREGWVARAMAEIESRPWTTLVLHDIAGWPDGTETGAMQRLEEFLGLLQAGGHEIVQQIDPACVPMRLGEIKRSMDQLAN
ncbi:MAG: polysaccharide deacetylase family protein [Alphaproteobacteria bacterium]